MGVRGPLSPRFNDHPSYLVSLEVFSLRSGKQINKHRFFSLISRQVPNLLYDNRTPTFSMLLLFVKYNI